MPGFLSVLNLDRQKHIVSPRFPFKKKIEIGSALFFSTTNSKFSGDKLFVENKDYVIIIDGAIFNKKSLMQSGSTWEHTVGQLYTRHGELFFKEFIGTFVGLLLDKKKNKWIIFNDPIGDKPLFIHKSDKFLIFGTDINHILETFRANNIGCSMDEQSAYMLLTFGYQMENFTMFSEIKKLKPGSYILIENDKYRENIYYRFTNNPVSGLKEKDIIEEIEAGFSQAVRRQYDKDLEYGYRHLAALSGGLDSRMTTWIAHKLGYRNVLNFTFSQSNYWDEKIPKKISADLKNEWIFKSLDNGLFLKSELDNVINLSHGSALYYGLAHGRSMFNLLDVENFGIVHSGQLGDVVIGTFYKNKKDAIAADDYKRGAYSQKLLFKIEDKVKEFRSGYQNNEIFRMYARGFAGANQGLLISQEKTETFSPFYDIDFMNYCLAIPYELRMGHQLYYKWVHKKNRQAGDYVWEKTGAKINSFYLEKNNKRYYLPALKDMIYKKTLGKVGFKLNTGLNSANHMNPLDYWYNTNSELKRYLDDFFENNIERLHNYGDLYDDAKMLFNTGNNIEKNQVITLLAFLKHFFN